MQLGQIHVSSYEQKLIVTKFIMSSHTVAVSLYRILCEHIETEYSFHCNLLPLLHALVYVTKHRWSENQRQQLEDCLSCFLENAPFIIRSHEVFLFSLLKEAHLFGIELQQGMKKNCEELTTVGSAEVVKSAQRISLALTAHAKRLAPFFSCVEEAYESCFRAAKQEIADPSPEQRSSVELLVKEAYQLLSTAPLRNYYCFYDSDDNDNQSEAQKNCLYQDYSCPLPSSVLDSLYQQGRTTLYINEGGCLWIAKFLLGRWARYVLLTNATLREVPESRISSSGGDEAQSCNNASGCSDEELDQDAHAQIMKCCESLKLLTH